MELLSVALELFGWDRLLQVAGTPTTGVMVSSVVDFVWIKHV
jgi:hypothetical protein